MPATSRLLGTCRGRRTMATRISAVLGTSIDEPTGDVVVLLQGESPKPYAIQVARGAVVKLIVTLVGQMHRTREKYQGSPEMQPAILTGVRKLAADDQFGLELMLDGGLPLGILIDPRHMPLLRSELSKLEELAGAAKPNQPRH